MLEDMIIYKKIYQMILWLYPTIKQFPKSEKFVLGQQLETTALKSLTLFIDANNSEDKTPYLKKMTTELEKLRILLRLAKDLKLLPFNKYETSQKHLNEIFALSGGLKKRFSQSS